MIPQEIVKRGFWYHQREPDFPPQASQSLSDGIVDGRLCLSVTDASLTPYQEHKLKTSWAAEIKGNEEVRFLWLPFKVNQQLFDAVCALPNLEGLWIKRSGITGIEAVAALEQLRYFHLGSSTRLADIRPLKVLEQLRWLEMENLKQISDFSVLATLTHLQGLAIEGSMWTTQWIETLAPLQHLEHLGYLSLANTRADDTSLRYLHGLKKIVTFHHAAWWPEGELERLERALPGWDREA